jgi:hypothetical protein
MKKLLSLAIAVCMIQTVAANATESKHHTRKSSKAGAHKSKTAKAVDAKSGPLVDEDDKEFDAKDATVTELQCELGNKITIYRHANDDEHIALRWHQRVHQMSRVATSTGAHRFENTRYKLVWIGIPAKGMLLDSKHGQQLANECKDAEQMAEKPVASTDAPKLISASPPTATGKVTP